VVVGGGGDGRLRRAAAVTEQQIGEKWAISMKKFDFLASENFKFVSQIKGNKTSFFEIRYTFQGRSL
jgi:hypothetical protein